MSASASGQGIESPATGRASTLRSGQHGRRTLPLLASLIAAVAALALTASPAFAERTYESQIKEANGAALGEPFGLALDPADNLWVTDVSNHVIDKFNSSASFLVQGSGEGSFEGSRYIESAAWSSTANRLFVSDSNNDDVWGFEPNAAYAGIDLKGPWGTGCCYIRVAADPSAGPAKGDLYVAGSGRLVYRVNPEGHPVDFTAGASAGTNELSGANTPDGSFNPEHGALAVDNEGNLYVADAQHDLVDKFSSTGEYLSQFTETTGGHLPGGIVGIAVDPSNGNVLIASSSTNTVYEFSSGGEFLGKLTEANGTPFGGVQGIAVSSAGTLYVADPSKHVVDIFGAAIKLPKITYEPVSSPKPTSVTLHATVDPNGGGNVTACEFEYGTTTSYELGKIPCNPNPASSPPGSNFSTPTAITAELTGLTPETTYHYRVIATDGNGTQKGGDRAYTAHAVTELTTEAATEVTNHSATFNASYVGEGKDTHYYFEWGTTSSYGNKTPLSPADNGSAAGPQALSVPVTLEAEKTYHFRIVAENEYGTTVAANEQTLTTPPAIASLVTGAATEVTNHTATLNGSYVGEGKDTHYYFEYGTTPNYGHLSEVLDSGVGTGPQQVSAPVSELAPDTTYHFRLIAESEYGKTVAANEGTFTTARSPTIDAFSSSGVTSSSADLHALINPHGFPTKYRFEYGTSTAYGHSAPIPDGEINQELSVSHPVNVHITGLEPVTYHFRVVAENEWGTTTSEDQAFEFFPSACPNSAIRQQTGSAYLPDCRAYELVSPANANGTLLYPGGPNTGQASSPPRFSFTGAYSAVPGENTVNTGGDLYVATRTDTGWQSKYVGLPGNQAACMGGPPNDEYSRWVFENPPWLTNTVATDPSMSKFLLWLDGDPFSCVNGNNLVLDATYPYAAPSNAPYMFGADGALERRIPSGVEGKSAAVEAMKCPYPGPIASRGVCSGDVSPSSDLSHLAFSSRTYEFASGGLTQAPGSAYDDNLETNTVSLISKLPSGQPIPQDPTFAGVPASGKYGEDITEPGGAEEFIRFPAVSSNGSRILMSTATATTPLCGKTEDPAPCQRFTDTPVHLYMSIDDLLHYEIAEGKAVSYVGMTPDGEHVYFTSPEQLLPEDTDTSVDLYMWSAKKAENGEQALTLLSKGTGGAGNSDSCEASWIERCGVLPWSGYPFSVVPIKGGNGISDSAIASENGDIYFFSPEQLDGDLGVLGKANLYDYRAGRPRFVATFEPGPYCTQTGFFSGTTICSTSPIPRMDVSPDDSHAAFLTTSRLTSYDNEGHLEMYAYAPAEERIVCVSCRPDGKPPLTDVQASQDGLFMTDDGRTFFTTTEALVPQDTNEAPDVYEYVDGRPRLITPGTGTSPPPQEKGVGNPVATSESAGLTGVSANGTDVYFSTFDQLVSEDHNGNFYRFYDARTNGGFPQPPAVQPCAAAEECHGSGTEAPTLPTQATAATLAGGNFAVAHAGTHHAKHHKPKRKRHLHRRRASHRRRSAR